MAEQRKPKGMTRRSGAQRLLRKAARSIVTLKGSPRAIALGTAIGVLIAFTPTIGLQMLLGAFVATLVGASRPAAMIPAWITNPVTIAPIYAFTYWLGRIFWSGPPVSEVYDRLISVTSSLSKFSWHEFFEQFAQFLRIGMDVFIAMMIGGVLVGGLLGAASYPLVFRATEKYQQKLAEHRRRRPRGRVKGRAAKPPADNGETRTPK